MSFFSTLAFPVLATALSFCAYRFPEPFTLMKPAIVPLLAFIMFCMGMTLTLQHFLAVLKKPAVIVLGISLQFLVMPFCAWLIALVLELPKALLIGMVLVGCSSGGTASNVICYLAKGNVALSILMTLLSTLVAVFAMPGLSYLYLYETVDIAISAMMQSILFMVVLPVCLGTALNTFFGTALQRLQSIFPALSSLAIMLIIAIIIALNHNQLQSLSGVLLLAVILHNSLGLLTGYFVPCLTGFDKSTCRTLAIEVGMQNSGLSVALAIKYFSVLSALPGALFSIWHNISGCILAAYWRANNAQNSDRN